MADMPQKRSYQRRTPYNNKNRQMKNETLSSDTKVRKNPITSKEITGFFSLIKLN